jgi:hypothetical protein
MVRMIQISQKLLQIIMENHNTYIVVNVQMPQFSHAINAFGYLKMKGELKDICYVLLLSFIALTCPSSLLKLRSRIRSLSRVWISVGIVPVMYLSSFVSYPARPVAPSR